MAAKQIGTMSPGELAGFFGQLLLGPALQPPLLQKIKAYSFINILKHTPNSHRD